MTRAHRASGAEGAWVWKDAYEAAEVAVVMFVRRYGRAMRQRAGAGAEGPRRMLDMLAAVAALEPSAGTGLLAVMAECALGKSAEGRLHLNEIAAVRAGLLARLFPQHPVTVTVSPEATPVPANASVTGLACIDTRWTACAPPPAVTAKSPGTGVDRRSSVSE